MKPPLGRMNLLEGVNGSLLFDDSYNSSPIAAEAAIEVLSEYPAKKKNRRFGRYGRNWANFLEASTNG